MVLLFPIVSIMAVAEHTEDNNYYSGKLFSYYSWAAMEFKLNTSNFCCHCLCVREGISGCISLCIELELWLVYLSWLLLNTQRTIIIIQVSCLASYSWSNQQSASQLKIARYDSHGKMNKQQAI